MIFSYSCQLGAKPPPGAGWLLSPRGWLCSVRRQRQCQRAEMLPEEAAAPLPLGAEGCFSSCPYENKIALFSVVLTAMLKSSHFPTKEKPSEKPKQTLTQATLEVGLSYKHRKLNTNPGYIAARVGLTASQRRAGSERSDCPAGGSPALPAAPYPGTHLCGVAARGGAHRHLPSQLCPAQHTTGIKVAQ